MQQLKYNTAQRRMSKAKFPTYPLDHAAPQPGNQLPFVIDQEETAPVRFADPLLLIKDLQMKLYTAKLQAKRRTAEAVDKAIEQERIRMGQELHDNINQVLSCAKLFYTQLHPQSAAEQQALSKGHELLLLAIKEIRQLSKQLVQPLITGKNLLQHINELITTVRAASSLDIHFVHNLQGHLLTKEKSTHLYRILQELLKNTAMHSHATHVDILLQTNNGNAHLMVRDNGKGAEQMKPNEGIGLSNIRERVESLKGTASISSQPGQGFTVEIFMPGDGLTKKVIN